MVSVRNLADLSITVHRAGRASGTGSGWIATTTVLALTVATWLALVVTGGTWMFYERFQASAAASAEAADQAGGQVVMDYLLPELYLQLAYVACTFVIPTIIALVAQSAVLGASGRERRLATLRLLGLTNGDITRMTMIETGIQTLLGLALGTIFSIATAPFWALIQFNNEHLATWDMLLPWWGYPIVWAIVVVLALLASVLGLMRVLISPLGVSRREPPKALRWWRLLFFVAALVLTVVVVNSFDPAADGLRGTLIMVLVLLLFFSSVNTVSPLILQLLAKASWWVPGATNFLASRRVATQPKDAWRRVSAMAFLALLLGFVSLIPTSGNEQLGATVVTQDIVTGAVITFLIGYLVLLMSTVLTQAAAVFEQAELTRALDFIGAPTALHRRVAFQQTFIPLLVVSVLSFVLGSGISYLMMGQFADTDIFTSRSVVIVVGFALAITSVAAATVSVDPLRRRLLGTRTRRND